MVGEKILLKGRGVVGGVAHAQALVSTRDFMFAHGINPKSGVIIDRRNDLYGASIVGKVFIFPYGTGSTTGAAWILEAVRNGKHPAAVINIRTEPIIAIGFILAELIYDKKIPVVDNLNKNPIEVIKTGDYVKVDGDKGIVEVFRHRTKYNTSQK